MENREFKISIEKSYRPLACVSCIVWFGCSYGIFLLLEDRWDIRAISLELVLILMFILVCYFVYKFESYFPNVQVLQAKFYHDRVILKKGKANRSIYYKDISEVGKIMILTKERSEKGYYRVKIKNRGRSYVIYSTADEYEKHLNFEQTELSKLYLELKARGVKCC